MPRKTGKPRKPRSSQYADLADYFAQSGDSQANFAKALRLSQGYVSQVVAGRKVPRPDLALRIATAAHIPLDSFTRVYLLKRGAA